MHRRRDDESAQIDSCCDYIPVDFDFGVGATCLPRSGNNTSCPILVGREYRRRPLTHSPALQRIGKRRTRRRRRNCEQRGRAFRRGFCLTLLPFGRLSHRNKSLLARAPGGQSVDRSLARSLKEGGKEGRFDTITNQCFLGLRAPPLLLPLPTTLPGDPRCSAGIPGVLQCDGDGGRDCERGSSHGNPPLV